LFIGANAQGKQHLDNGQLAAVQWQNGIPSDLQHELDERRRAPEWFTSLKYESLSLDLGEPRSALSYVAAIDASTQQFERGLLMYNDGSGVAFEMHGAIWAAYNQLADTSPLGYLVSDETDSKKGGGRKSLFSQGGIYWSPASGAVPVIGHLYLDYERMGEASAIGFPTQLATSTAGGLEQVFQSARMYYKNGASSAHEVHGAILARFLATGGAGRWGFPLTDESPVHDGTTEVGRTNEFEHSTFYWSAGTGAFEVHGDIRERYRAVKGPIGALGFPTSDEGDIPGAGAPARFNTFQHGSLLWFGSAASITLCLPFKLHIGRIDTQESEGLFMGQNDLYFRVTLKDGAATLFNDRYPAHGDYGGHNVIDPSITLPTVITPNRADQVLTLTIDMWDSDDGAPFGGGDDHLGTWTKQLTMATGWGLRENSGILHSGHVSKINDIAVGVQPQVDASTLTDAQKWWGVGNPSTPAIAYKDYATAFADVDSEPEDWDITDWLDKAFYSLVAEGLAANGNCFGMSLAAIDAGKGHSVYSLPLDRFTNVNTVIEEFNIKHEYQVGAGPIWWFVGEFLSGRTHAPTDVFSATATEFARGNNPVLCIAQHSDFSGAPHCIMPVRWDTTTTPWTIWVQDPNFPGGPRPLQVNAHDDTFHYDGGNIYDGGSSSGGRMHYMPYDLLSSRQRTPVWDAILLILAGTILILGDDAETVSLTDAQGNDLDAFGDRAREIVAGHGTLDDFFFGVQGFNRRAARPLRPTGPPPPTPPRPPKLPPTRPPVHPPMASGVPIVGELLLRRGRSIDDVALGRRRTRLPIGHLPINQVAKSARGKVGAVLAQDPKLLAAVGNHTVNDVLANPDLLNRLTPHARELVAGLRAAAASQDFTHTVRGKRNGSFEYVLKSGLSQVHVTSPLGSGEQAAVRVQSLGTSRTVLGLTGQKDKQATVRVDQKLGVTGDRLAITVDGVPVAAEKPVQINARPGLGGVEVVADGSEVNVDVRVEAVVAGRTVSRRYAVPLHGGVRISPAGVLAHGGLAVSRIQQVFGPAVNRRVVRPKR
jgi:hypothetical protein